MAAPDFDPYLDATPSGRRRVTDWALGQKYLRSSRFDEVLEKCLAFEKECAAAEYHSRYIYDRRNMSRADRNAYAHRCEALAKAARAKAQRLYDELVRLVYEAVK